MAVEPDVRDVAADGLVDEGLGRGPKGGSLGQPDQALERGHQVEAGAGRRVHKVVHEGHGDPAGLDPDRLLAVLVDHVVAAVSARRARLAVADVGPGQVLELERDVLGDVADPRALAQAGDEAAPPAQRAGVVLEAGQQPDQGIDEAGDRIAGELLEVAQVDEHPHDRLARPVVRAAQDPRLDDRETRLGPGGGRTASARRLRSGRRCGLGHENSSGGSGHSTATRLGRPRWVSSRQPPRRRAPGASASRSGGGGGDRSGSPPAASGGRRR